MKIDTMIYKSLRELGYKNDYIITEQGLIIDTASNSLVKQDKNWSYRLTLENG